MTIVNESGLGSETQAIIQLVTAYGSPLPYSPLNPVSAYMVAEEISAGSWSADLTPNTSVSPGGTLYRVELLGGGGGYRYIDVPAGGPFDVGALIAEPLGPFPPTAAVASLGFLHGTGSPEGAVTAAVGTLYSDDAVTLGAGLWRKATGAGNTGWLVVSGDTGWRRIASWTGGVQDGSDQIGTLNTTDFTLNGSESLEFRRVNSRLWIRSTSVSGGGLVFNTAGDHDVFTANVMPSGFQIGGQAYGAAFSRTGLVFAFGRSGTGTTFRCSADATGNTSRGLSDLPARLDIPWPTTSPGVAGQSTGF